jgi:hypothetical protein
MSDIGLTFAPIAKAQAPAGFYDAATAALNGLLRSLRLRLALHILGLTAFISIGVLWPGAVLLAIIFLMAARAAVTATAEFHAALSDRGDARWWLRWVGVGALVGAIPTLALLSGAVAIVPVLAGAWCAARARSAWVFASGTACLALGLMALTAFGATHVAPIAFVVIQAASTGAIMLALSFSTPHDRPAEANPALLPCRNYELSA